MQEMQFNLFQEDFRLKYLEISACVVFLCFYLSKSRQWILAKCQACNFKCWSFIIKSEVKTKKG